MSLLDHRQLADEMELYCLNENLGAGLPLWLPNGAALRGALEDYIHRREDAAGYERVYSPHLAKASLFERSGHLRHYREDMFPPMKDGAEELYLKPMNCPMHHEVFGLKPRSHRELPLRLAECGHIYRHENSGSLRGLQRVRGLCQNDAHIYVAPESARAELHRVLDLFDLVHQDLGLHHRRFRLSSGDRNVADFEGDPRAWDSCEDLLREVLRERGVEYFEAPGEAAFYGPKIDVQMKLGEIEESVASVQLDFLSAHRFDLNYAAADGDRRRPWIIHRAPLGSFERMIAVLLEAHQGRLPDWLQPLQVWLIPVEDRHRAFAEEWSARLRAGGYRSRVDARDGRLAKRVALAHRLRPALQIVVGDREVQGGDFRVQSRDSVMEVAPQKLLEVIARRMRSPGPPME